MKTKLSIALVSITLAFCAISYAQVGGSSDSADPRVRSVLDNLAYKYKIDKDGDYHLTFNVDNSRSQEAIIFSRTEKYGNLEIREIHSAAYKSKDSNFSASVANRLLQDSRASKLGGWVKDGSYAVFVIQIAADANVDSFRNALELVINRADVMEKELTDKDDF